MGPSSRSSLVSTAVYKTGVEEQGAAVQLSTEQALQPCLAPELGWDTNFSTGLPRAADFVPRILLYCALLAEAPEDLLGWEAEGKEDSLALQDPHESLPHSSRTFSVSDSNTLRCN